MYVYVYVYAYRTFWHDGYRLWRHVELAASMLMLLVFSGEMTPVLLLQAAQHLILGKFSDLVMKAAQSLTHIPKNLMIYALLQFLSLFLLANIWVCLAVPRASKHFQAMFSAAWLLYKPCEYQSPSFQLHVCMYKACPGHWPIYINQNPTAQHLGISKWAAA